MENFSIKNWSTFYTFLLLYVFLVRQYSALFYYILSTLLLLYVLVWFGNNFSYCSWYLNSLFFCCNANVRGCRNRGFFSLRLRLHYFNRTFFSNLPSDTHHDGLRLVFRVNCRSPKTSYFLFSRRRSARKFVRAKISTNKRYFIINSLIPKYSPETASQGLKKWTR